MYRTISKLSYFGNVPKAPPDSILGLSALFGADKDPNKVNLAVGVYRDGAGKPFILDSVRKAGNRVVNEDTQMDYAPINGLTSYLESTQKLCFGDALSPEAKNSIASIQTLSGTGALHMGAEFLRKFNNVSSLYLPQPTYPNHLGIFGVLGLEVKYYPYYDMRTHTIHIKEMLDGINRLDEHSFVLFHACAHNPTGCDLSPEECKEIVQICEKRKLVVFVDMAYQGFATGDTERDALLPRLFLQSSVPALLVAQSFAKNFGLYGHRAGALHIKCGSSSEKENVLSQTASVFVRPSYSNPPIFGARVVDTILRDQELKPLWESELQAMSSRLSNIRKSFVKELETCGCTRDLSHLGKGVGMMSLTGLSEQEVIELRDKYHIYMTLNGRLAFSGLTDNNVKYVAESFTKVINKK